MAVLMFSLTCVNSIAAPVGVKDITAGTAHSLALLDNGCLFAWGSNFAGELGNGLYEDSATSSKVLIEGVESVDAGYDHNIVIKKDGTVWAWGKNDRGQLGDDTVSVNDPIGVAIPVRVKVESVKSVSAGSLHSVAIKNDGTVWVWGCGKYGCLGNNDTSDKSIPTQVVGLSNIEAVSAGADYTLALDNDGNVWAFGANGEGQLGDGTTHDRWNPVRVPIENVNAIYAGYDHSLAIKKDGTVWTWGNNDEGQLGDGTTSDRHFPVIVKGLSDVKCADLAYQFSIAVKNDGTLWAWGSTKSKGLFADGNYYYSHYDKPVNIATVSNVDSIASGNGHILALKKDEQLLAWGDNVHGQVGDGSYAREMPYARLTPVDVPVSLIDGSTIITNPNVSSSGLTTHPMNGIITPVNLICVLLIIVVITGMALMYFRK